MVWVHFAANIHWLLTFVGAQRRTRRSLKKLYPFFGTNLSISQLLRAPSELKHECFARVRVYNLHGADSRVNDVQWRTNPDCISAVPNMEGRSVGLIINRISLRLLPARNDGVVATGAKM